MKLLLTTILSITFITASLGSDFVLKFSHAAGVNTPKHKAAKYFELKLEEYSKGKIDVQVYPEAQLVGSKGIMTTLNLGVVQMAAPTFSKFNSIAPQLSVFDLPFLFKDFKHVHSVQDGKIGDRFRKVIDKKGFKALDFWDNGFKQISTAKDKALLEPTDAKGQTFRIYNSTILKEQFNVLDAKTKIISFSKVFNALKNKEIDGQENTLSNINANTFYKVQKNLTLTSHGYLGYLVVVSRKFWNKLPSNLQKDLVKAMKEATVKERAYAKALDTESLQKIQRYATQSKLLKIHKLDADQLENWQDAVKPIYKKFYDNNVIGEDLIEDILDLR